jgi:hypothetical protein
MQAECKHKKIIFILPFFLLFFFVFYKIILIRPLFLFFKFTCVEFQVWIMLHFAYSIVYIKSQTITVVKCNDIALNSCEVLLSFFVIDVTEVKQDQYFSRMATNRSTFNFIQYSTSWYGVFNLRQHFEISYSRYANKHYITGVYITINDSYR